MENSQECKRWGVNKVDNRFQISIGLIDRDKELGTFVGIRNYQNCMLITQKHFHFFAVPLIIVHCFLSATSLRLAADSSKDSKPLLTDLQFQEIIDHVAAKGIAGSLPSRITTALNPTRNGQTLIIRQGAYKDKTGAIHMFATLDNYVGYIIGVGDYNKQFAAQTWLVCRRV